jgi:hypothetical protein
VGGVHWSLGRRDRAGRKGYQAGGAFRRSILVVGGGEASLVPRRVSRGLRGLSRAYIESFWLSHLDLAYTLPFLGRIGEAKQHVAALLKMYPTMTIREADAFYKLVCFDAAYREKMVGALRQAGLPE